MGRTAFTTRDQASTAICHCIEGFYNPRRQRSSVDYVRPVMLGATFRLDKRRSKWLPTKSQ
jgi:hypothetical protein